MISLSALPAVNPGLRVVLQSKVYSWLAKTGADKYSEAECSPESALAHNQLHVVLA